MRKVHTLTVLGLFLAGVCLLPGGCDAKRVKNPKAAPPPPTFTGPAYLHGTIGSLCSLRGQNLLLVSGYGVVVNLPGTGSAEVPAFLRQRLLNEARLKGVGSARLGTENMSPSTLLASPNTAVVAVEGLIPPGAVKGTPFDVLVTALPQTQTTNLEAGQLWTTELGIEGTNPTVRFTRPLATANGTTYVNPFEDSTPQRQQLAIRRKAVIVSGGTVAEDRRIELVLNTPSWQRAGAIADRINERFPHDKATQFFNTAVGKSDLIVQINVPARFASDPGRLLELIGHLYLQRSPDFEPQQAQKLADVLRADLSTSASVRLAWQSLGKTALPVVRRHYMHPRLAVRMAALEAGAGLEDEAVAEPAADLAGHDDPAVRTQVAGLLANLPRSLRGARILHGLLNDRDRAVRIAAYESLARISDPLLNRVPILKNGDLKFVLDLVPSDRPLIFVSQVGLPRVAVFNPNAGFVSPMLASLWDGRLRLRSSGAGEAASVFFQPWNSVEGTTHQIAPTVGNLVFLLAHAPSVENPTNGLDLTYSNVVNALFHLATQKHIDAEFEIRASPLVEAVTRAREASEAEVRPETADPQPATPAPQNEPAP